jgi:aldose 1-epimerase
MNSHTHTSLPVRRAGFTAQTWGRLPGGDTVRLFTLRNVHGMKVTISDFGGTLVSWQTPDRSGRMGEILLGYDTPEAYLRSDAYLGALIGRWANRIANARFTLDGVNYPLDCNQSPNLLHGGASGFHRMLWEAEEDDNSLILTLESPEGDAGFPGNLSVQVRYALDDEGTLSIDYQAVSDAPTPINLTSHPYFNLSARHGSDIRGHLLQIDADHYFEVDADMIPIRRSSVSGSAFDFRQAAPIGTRLDWPHAQLAQAGGFDHCYALRKPDPSAGAVREVARAYDPGSGRELIVATDQSGLQLYTGNHLAGAGHTVHGGLCLEAGGFPNQINMDEAEDVVLRPGQVYRQTTHYRVAVRDY